MSRETPNFVTTLPAEKLQNFFGVFLQFHFGVDKIWQRTSEQRSAQMVFCDLSIPGKGQPIEMAENEQGVFEMTTFQNVYDDLRDKLIAKGIPAEEIAYIHSANTEVQKKELFGKVRSGQIRVLLGSTQKMGAGTNVQRKLVALHHLDCPWRPSDDGRTLRTHIKAEALVGGVSAFFQGRM